MIDFPNYVPAIRVGAPTVSIYPRDFKAKDVYEVDFQQKISAKPGHGALVSIGGECDLCSDKPARTPGANQ